MAYFSSPLSSDTSSNPSSSFSDCGTNSTSVSTIYSDMSGGNRDYLSMSASPPKCSTMEVDTAFEGNPKTCNTRRRRYATDEDWRRHRERISSLYKAKRLKDVMAIMETEHNLYATERMYKARFKEWGLQKNVTAAEVHKLMQKVEQEQQRRHQTSPYVRKGRVVLDVGDDFDVRRIQKYMKRRPKGLDKLRNDPHRPLEVIKAMSVDGCKGPGMVSIATVKLEGQGQNNDSMLTTPSSSLDLSWSPGPDVPNDITQLLQTFIDNGFDEAYAYPCSPSESLASSLSPQWQQHHGHDHSNELDRFNSSFEAVSSRDEAMLDFVLKFRVAHILLDEGFMQPGFQAISMCMDSLAVSLQRNQDTSSLNTRPATVVVLWVLSAALEMMLDFRHTKTWVLHMLYQRLTTLCAAYQPTMAEIMRQLSQLGSLEQEAMINLARQMISRALFADPSYYEPSFETYSRTVDVAVGSLSAPDKVQAMHTLANKPVLPGTPALDAWVEIRIALAMCELSPYLPQEQYPLSSSIGLCGPAMALPWHVQESKIVSAFDHISGKVQWHKSTGSWQTAQELARQAASLAEVVCGYDGEMRRRFMEEVETLRSSGQMPCSMALLEPSLVAMSIPLADMFGQGHSGGSSWQQETGALHSTSLPHWGAQLDGTGTLGSSCGLMYNSAAY